MDTKPTMPRPAVHGNQPQPQKTKERLTREDLRDLMRGPRTVRGYRSGFRGVYEGGEFPGGSGGG